MRILIDAGYVEKRAFRNDQKTKALWATKMAVAFNQQMSSVVEEAESVILTSLTKEEAAQFKRHLKMTNDNIERHLNHRRAFLATEALPSIERI